MAHKARTLLIDSYGIEESKIIFIPHGIPDVPFTRSDSFKTRLGLKDRKDAADLRPAKPRQRD